MCTSRCPHALPRVAPNHTCLRTVPFSSCRNLTSIRVRSARRDAATSASSCPRQRSSPSPEQLASRSGCTGAVAQHDDDHISRLARDPRVRLVGALAAVLWPWLGATSAQAHIPLTPPSSASRPAYESLYEDSDSSSSRPSQSELALRQLGGAPPLAGPSSRTSGARQLPPAPRATRLQQCLGQTLPQGRLYCVRYALHAPTRSLLKDNTAHALHGPQPKQSLLSVHGRHLHTCQRTRAGGPTPNR